MIGVYTGKGMVLAHGAIGLEGMLTVAVQDDARGLVKPLDGTAAEDATYYFEDDPMGSEGAPKASITVTAHDSANSVADTKINTVALNTSATLVFTTAAAQYSNIATLSGAILRRRTTTIKWQDIGQQEVEFGANNANIAWTNVA
jgi:hypothetical protein